MKKNNKYVTLVSIIATVAVVAVAAVIIIGISMPKTSEIIQGEAELSDYRVSSKIPARVLELRVKEGQLVSKGDTLVILEAPDIQAKLNQAYAALEAADAQHRKAINGTRQEQIQGVYETWQKAIAAREVSEKTYNRMNRLFSQGVIAEQKKDEAEAHFKASVATERAAKSQYDMAVNGAREEDKQAASAQLQRAHGAVTEVSSYIEETVLIATADGTVTEIFPEIGELIGSGAPIMNIAKLDDVWFTFNVREDYLPGLEVGKQIDVYLPAFDKTVRCQISLMKDVGSFAAWKATKALDGFDLKTFEVQAIPINADETKSVRSGMSAIIK